MNFQEYHQNFTLYQFTRKTIHWELKKHIVNSQERKGRKDYDAPHTLNVVNYVEWLIDINHSKVQCISNLLTIKNPSFVPINPIILLITAYAHDWAYTEILKSSDYESIKEVKYLHMHIGAEKIAELLNMQKQAYREEVDRSWKVLSNLGHHFPPRETINYTGPFWFLEENDWISQIANLVKVHDDFDKLCKEPTSVEYWHERIFIMADTLGMLRTIQPESNFSIEETKQFLNNVHKYRLPMFLDNFPEAKDEFNDLFKFRENILIEEEKESGIKDLR